MKLHISDNLALPIDAVTSTFAILAKRGAGKSYTASVMAEEMLAADQQIIVLDPTSAWFGLRSSADGKSPGFPVVVFGGEHADVPLEESAGELIAQTIIENRFSAILDLGLFRKGQTIRFMVNFAETLYRLNRETVHLFCDEADAFAPQGRSYGGEENRMLGAMEDIVRRGRRRGIGCTLITQRPAVLNKNVLTQAESLFCLRMVHPKDIDAVSEWVNVHADPDQAAEVIASLPSLKIGEAWFWSPGWMGVLKRVQVRTRKTFDSSATPKPGEIARKPKTVAEIDLNALGERIRATIERAKADDPRELKKKIADLEKQLRNIPEAKPQVERVEIPVLKNGQLDRTEKIIGRTEEISRKLIEEVTELKRLVQPACAAPPVPVRPPLPKPGPLMPKPKPAPTSPRPVPAADGDYQTLTGPEQRILDALAWLESIGNSRPEQTAVAFLADYRVGGGAWNNPKGRLRGKGLIEYAGDCLSLTDDGRQAANAPEESLTTQALQAKVMGRLNGPEQRILTALIEAYPQDLDKAELAERAGYSLGGAFNNPLGRLRSLGLAEYPEKGRARAADLLFLE